MSLHRAPLLFLVLVLLATSLFGQALSTDLSLTKDVTPLTGTVGQPFTFTIVVTNNGPAAASGVVVSDTLPAGMTASSATSTVGTCSGTTAITCNVGALATFATATITIVATTTTVGIFDNTATVTLAETDLITANNTDAARGTAAAAAVPNPVPAVSPLGLAALALLLGAAALVAMRFR